MSRRSSVKDALDRYYKRQLPKQKKSKTPSAIPSEHKEQVAICTVLRAAGILHFAVPNGGARDNITGARLKAEGVSRGVCDLLVVDRPPNYPHLVGLALEVKRRKGGSISHYQKDWLNAFADRGFAAWVVKGSDAALQLFKHLGYIGVRNVGQEEINLAGCTEFTGVDSKKETNTDPGG